MRDKLRFPITTYGDFERLMIELGTPDHPATCDQCGLEGTNESLEAHVCPEVMLEVQAIRFEKGKVRKQ